MKRQEEGCMMLRKVERLLTIYFQIQQNRFCIIIFFFLINILKENRK